MRSNIDDRLWKSICAKAEKDGQYATAVGLVMIAEAIHSAAYLLGNANAATPMGAIEGLGFKLCESIDHFASSIAAAIVQASEK